MKIVIEVGDIEYSKLSKQLAFKVVCNMDAILATEDSMLKPADSTMEEVAVEMGKADLCSHECARVCFPGFDRNSYGTRYD